MAISLLGNKMTSPVSETLSDISFGTFENTSALLSNNCLAADGDGDSEVDRKTKEIERLEEVVAKLERANTALVQRILGGSQGGSSPKTPSKTAELLEQSCKLIQRLRNEIEASKADSQLTIVEKSEVFAGIDKTRSTEDDKAKGQAKFCLFDFSSNFCL